MIVAIVAVAVAIIKLEHYYLEHFHGGAFEESALYEEYDAVEPIMPSTPPRAVTQTFRTILKTRKAIAGIITPRHEANGSAFFLRYRDTIYLLTAAHVIDDLPSFIVRDAGGYTPLAQTMSSDDIAVLLHDDIAVMLWRKKLPSFIIPLELSQDNEHPPGTPVAMICDPIFFIQPLRIGLLAKPGPIESTLTAMRVFEPRAPWGCSGSPLILQDGSVAGMVRKALLDNGEQYLPEHDSRMRFSVPASAIRRVLDRIESKRTPPF